MVKKLFALASVSALAGLVSAAGVSGCTTETVTQGGGGDAGTPDAKKDAKPNIPGDDEEDPGDDLPACLKKDQVDPEGIAYTKVGATKGACTEQEQKDIKKFLDDAIAAQKLDFKQSEWSATVGDSCAQCVFTEADADSWGIIIQKDDQFVTYNRGACVEAVSGNEACGRSYHRFQACVLVACGSCKTQDEFDACTAEQEAIFTGPCAGFIEEVQKECGANVGAYENACKGSPLETGIKVVCIQGGVGDVDAGDGGN